MSRVVAEGPTRTARAAAACTVGLREVELADGDDGSSAVVVTGYIREGDRGLTAADLLARWRHAGPELLRRLSGEFALAIWVDGQLVLARDRLGTRPLYVAELPAGQIAFATSMKPLLAAGVDAAIDRDAVVRGLVLGYIPAPQTMLAGVRQLGPGEAWWLAPWRKTWRYYRPRERLDRRRTLAASGRLLDRAVTRAVARALPPEGRVGAFLSGGIDSSLVLARLHEGGTAARAFTLHFGDHLAGELRYARAVARHLGVPHDVLEVDDRKFCDAIAPALAELEDLLSEPIAVPNYLLAAEAARHVDVLFTGEGGDPPFGGPKNIGMALAFAYRDLPAAPSLADAYLSAYHHLADDLDQAITPEWLACFDRSRLSSDVFGPFFGPCSGDNVAGPRRTFVGRLMLANTVLKGGSNILVKVAKMVGAHELRLRSPLFDPDLVGLAFTIPPWHKLRGTEEKLVLRAAAARSLPREVLDRSKRGMGVPLRAWFAGRLGELARDVLTERAVRERGLFRWSYVARLLGSEPLPSDLARSRGAEKLWLVLVTELAQRTIERLVHRRLAA
jgi:asparagine synthase (glutamine-hydrolysing)